MKRLLLFLLIFLPLTMQAQTEEVVDSVVTEQPDAIPEVAQPAVFDTTKAENLPALRFGYLSYDSALRAMPDYVRVQQELDQKYEAFEKEMQRVEDEFNQKYEAFLEGLNEFPRTILLKRQNELQELMQRNIDFKAQARKELQQAEVDALQPLRNSLNKALATIATKMGLALVINTDANACPFIDPTMGTDLQRDVLMLLK